MDIKHDGIYCGAKCDITKGVCNVFNKKLAKATKFPNIYFRDKLCLRLDDINGAPKKELFDPSRGRLSDPPNKKVYDGTEGWEKSTEDMCKLECDSVNINLRWICGLLAPLLLFYSFFTACGDNTWLFAGNILLFFIALFVATTALHVPTITIRKQKIRHRILDYTNDLIFDNLTQTEAALCAKISKFPNKNKLIKQCKEYAQTLMNSKTDQSIEPLLTKLHDICEEQLNVGLKENVREIECFISAIEEVEERSEVLNSNEYHNR